MRRSLAAFERRLTAQDVARDFIEDLDPAWLLIVGICGAVPSADFTLGDVVCATRVHDFSVRAAAQQQPGTFDVVGGPMHRLVENVLASLPPIVREVSGWNNRKSLRQSTPSVVVPDEASDRCYGDAEWQAAVRKSLLHHFPPGKKPRSLLVTAQSVGRGK